MSDTVSHAEFDDFFCTQRFDFKDSYIGGETVRFSFTINTGSMLTLSDGGYFYEFVPGWFNAIPVESYTFKWKLSDHVLSHNASAIEDGYAVWQGSLDCGGYVSMQVAYDESAFDPMTPPAVYTPFDGSDAYNSLTSDRIALGILFGAIALLLVIPQVFVVDCFVSYHRGRGFLRGYGHHHHVYGHNNPHYEKAAIVRGASGGGHYYRGGRSGGGFACACACACACAGGGRAGCSQKNTTALSEGEEKRTVLPILRYKK